MKKLILISIIIMLSITCFSQERQWKKTLKANTISYYKWFLNKYPESEFSEEATQKIIDLEFKKVQLIDTEAAYKNFLSDYGDNDYTNSDFVTKAREKIENFERQNNEKQKEIERRQKEKEKKLNSQIDKTRNYKIEEFTEKQFFDDGWNTKDAFEGKTGIVKMIYTIEKLEITLGVIGNVGGELGSEMKSLGFLAEQAYKNGKPYNYNMNAKDKICVFTFENGILVKKNYLLDSATIDEKKVLLTKNQNQVQTGTPDEILMDALKAKDYKNALILVQKVDSVNYSDDKNNSLLMFASAFEHTEVVKVLLDKGANVDLQETSGWTALMVASSKGYIEITNLLLNKGANVDLQEIHGFTALFYASKWGQMEVVKLLLDKGAKLDVQNDYAKTTLMSASENGHIEVVRLFLDEGAKLNLQDTNGFTALIWASSKGHTELVKLLLERGANPDIKTNEGKTAYDYAKDSNIKTLLTSSKKK